MTQPEKPWGMEMDDLDHAAKLASERRDDMVDAIAHSLLVGNPTATWQRIADAHARRIAKLHGNLVRAMALLGRFGNTAIGVPPSTSSNSIVHLRLGAGEIFAALSVGDLREAANFKMENKPMSEIHPPPIEFTGEQLAADPILRYFHYAHLPEKLRSRSRPFMLLAEQIVTTLPRNAERSAALRKLLEAKDCAVRAAVE